MAKRGYVSIRDDGNGWVWAIHVDGPRKFIISETGLFEESEALERAMVAAELFGIHIREPKPLKDVAQMEESCWSGCALSVEKSSAET